MKPGIFHGMPMEEYLAIRALSNGVIQTLLDECAAAAWYSSPWNPNRPADDTKERDAGSIAHSILLEGSRAICEVIDPAAHPAEKTGNIPDGWTNKSIRAARDAARAAGKIPVLKPMMAEINALVDSAYRFIESLRETEPAIYQAFQAGGGTAETVIVWQEGDTLCKLRADMLAVDFRLIVDYKSTSMSVEPSGWAKKIDYVGAAWYRRGVRAACGVDPDYVFMCGELKPPYLHSLVGVDPGGLALGDEKVGEGIRQWQACERAGRWPGYAPRVHWVELPVYERFQWEARNGVDADGIPYDISKLFGPPKEHPFSHKKEAT